MYCSYLVLYQSSDYVVCMIKTMFILNQQIHLYANLPYCSKCLNEYIYPLI